MQSESINARTPEPFLKWAGGKRWLIRKESSLAPESYNVYFEPFLGSAAVFFSLPNTPFVISDINNDLINCYLAIMKNHKEVESLVKRHQSLHCHNYYYQTRASEPENDIDKAARFIYLNRTCFNGLYRVNRQGKFNVPIGTKNHVIQDGELAVIATRLKQGQILNQDFEKTLGMAKEGDFVFIDPPYTVNHNLNGFLEYNEKIFSWDDQIRLKNSVREAQDRGVMITMSNADHESIHELYAGMCDIQIVERTSVIAGKASSRKTTSEVIMRFGWGEK